MSERPECAVCGYPLGHIDEACPRCLPGFYTPEYRNLNAENTTLKARLERTEARVAELTELLGSLADDADGYFRNWVDGAPRECKWVSLTLARRALANTTPAKPETHGGG